MVRTVEAVIDTQGQVTLLEAIVLDSRHRALVTILDEEPRPPLPNEEALASEAALADWNSPEEDQAWSHLQREQ